MGFLDFHDAERVRAVRTLDVVGLNLDVDNRGPYSRRQLACRQYTLSAVKRLNGQDRATCMTSSRSGTFGRVSPESRALIPNVPASSSANRRSTSERLEFSLQWRCKCQHKSDVQVICGPGLTRRERSLRKLRLPVSLGGEVSRRSILTPGRNHVEGDVNQVVRKDDRLIEKQVRARENPITIDECTHEDQRQHAEEPVSVRPR